MGCGFLTIAASRLTAWQFALRQFKAEGVFADKTW